jgi:hypothetical protein
VREEKSVSNGWVIRRSKKNRTPGNSKALSLQLQMEMGIEEHLEGYIYRKI